MLEVIIGMVLLLIGLLCHLAFYGSIVTGVPSNGLDQKEADKVGFIMMLISFSATVAGSMLIIQ